MRTVAAGSSRTMKLSARQLRVTLKWWEEQQGVHVFVSEAVTQSNQKPRTVVVTALPHALLRRVGGWAAGVCVLWAVKRDTSYDLVVGVTSA